MPFKYQKFNATDFDISIKHTICIHVDKKAEERFFEALESISKCFDNILLSVKREDVIYSHFTRLQVRFFVNQFLAHFRCRKFWKFQSSEFNFRGFSRSKNVLSPGSQFLTFDTNWPARKVTVKADLNCIDELLNQKRNWKYFINLCGQDFPIKTNSEIVSLMKTLHPHNSIESILVPLDDPHYQRFVSDLYHN